MASKKMRAVTDATKDRVAVKRAREQIRGEKISVSRQLATLAKVENKLNKNWLTLDSEQVSALRLSADIAFRKLAKVMPDLKAVEVSETDKNEFLFRFRMIGGVDEDEGDDGAGE